MLHWLVLPLSVFASDNGRAIRPPMGWRSWNQFACSADQNTMMDAIKGLVDESRLCRDGKPCSLASLGYTDVGLDDCWQACGNYGPDNNTYHDEHGTPQINLTKFPSMLEWTQFAHANNLTAGWYHNNCRCHDHCTSTLCFAADVEATIALGFDSVKLDGCGAEEDVALWSNMFNHSLREKGGTAGGKGGILIENCHNGQYIKGPGASTWPRPNGTHGYRLTNMPYFDAHGELQCPYHLYRSSTDIVPVFGSILVNLNTIPALADAHLSQPGCWAYPDMLEVGVKKAVSPSFPTLTATETQTHFGAWCIVSAPLTLSMDLTDKDVLDDNWALITNREALDVNQDWAGFSGSLFKESSDLVSFSPCHWGNPTKPDQCMFPAEQFWYKPLSGRDARQSVMAVLLMNNDAVPRNLSFAFNEIPGLKSKASTAFSLFDVWSQEVVAATQYGGYEALDVSAHGSVFLKIANM